MPALSELHAGDQAEIVSVTGKPGLVQRLSEFGLIEGEIVEFVGRAPLGDPIEIRIGNTRLTLRKTEALGITVRLTSTPVA